MTKILYIISQAFIWLQILIFGTYLMYPIPEDRIGSSMDLYFKEIFIYHANMQNIFYGYAIILLILFLLLFYKKKKETVLRYIILLLSFFTAIFAFCATRGYTWYFYGNFDRTNKSIIIIILCLTISFLLFKHLHGGYNPVSKNNKK